MDFKGFYDKIIFDVDKHILRKYTGKQGDTKSRGLYVTVTQRNVVIKDLTGLSMRLFYEKPDKTRGFIDGVVDGDKFRIDYTNQMFAVPGVVKAELRLMGANGEVITNKAFKISVDSSIADGSIISKDERGILDRAFELVEDIIPRLELLDVELLEDVQDEMLGARYSGTKDATYDSLGQRLDASEQDLLNHKAEYTSNRQQDQLKIAKVEKELNDYKATMQQININQEPKQKATGYGVISLPPNAAEGQVSGIKIEGLTATNIVKNGNFSQGTTGWAGFKSANTATNNVLSNIGDGTSQKPYAYQNLNISSPQSKKIFMRVKAKVTNTSCTRISLIAQLINAGAWVSDITVKTISSPTNGVVYTLYGIATLPSSGFDAVQFIVLHDYPDIATANGKVMEIQEAMVIVITGTELENLTADQINARIPYWFDSTKSTIGAFRIRSVSEDETQESSAYVIATDADTGEILELRSLPNGIKGEIRISEGKLIKRVSDEVVIDGSEDWTVGSSTLTETVSFKTPLSNLLSAGAILSNFAKYVTRGVSSDDTELFMALDGYLYIRILKTRLSTQDVVGFKSWLQANPITLTYQLAEPVEIPVQVSGTLVGYPSGTVYIEPFVADAGIYTDKMEVLYSDLPIKALEKLSKIDFMTGLKTELDVNDAVISEDKLSFTHPDLVDGDIVFYTYKYDRESTEGEAEIEYYDSRYVVKDSVTGKFYKWQVTVADGVPSIELKEV